MPLALDLVDDEDFLPRMVTVLPFVIQAVRFHLKFLGLRILFVRSKILRGLRIGSLECILGDDFVLVILERFISLAICFFGIVFRAGHRGITKPYPRNSTTLSGIAEVSPISLIPRIDGRHREGDLAFIKESLCGIAKPHAIYRLFNSPQSVVYLIIVQLIRVDSILDLPIFYDIAHFKVIAISIFHRFGQEIIQLVIVLTDSIVPLRRFLQLVDLRLKLFKAFTATNSLHDIPFGEFHRANSLRIPLFLDLNLILRDELRDLVFGEGLLVGILQPVGQAQPLVLSGLQTAVLFQHLQPLLRGGLVLLDAIQCLRSI